VRWTRIVMGVVMVVAGGTWLLQGLGVVPGTFMSHNFIWVVIGAFVVLAGVILLREAFGPGSRKGG
jgi:uncharacterized membrane protein YeaQ/YmgE (transglycosylase-associated protein family)